MSIGSILSVCVTALLTGLVLTGRRRVGGSTLSAVWWWILFSSCILLLVEAWTAVGVENSDWFAIVQYCGAVTTFCPLMSLLGAKRPQDRGWQFIVLSLLVVLLLPAAEALIYSRWGQFQVRDARAWFLWILIFVGLLNYLPTCNRVPAALVAVGQVLLLSPHLPLLRQPARPTLGLCLILSGVIIVATRRWRNTRPTLSAQEPLNRAWRDFRNTFGTVWALRVAERINANAISSDWPVRLGWRGFRVAATSGQHSDDIARGASLVAEEPLNDEVRRSMKTALRRFVSPLWIEQALGVDAREDASDAASGE